MKRFRLPPLPRPDEFCSHAPWLLLGALVLLVGVHPQLPADDALRHVVSYAWGYSHTAMYPQSTLTSFNQYPLFDRLAGAASQALGVFASLKLLQVSATAFSAWAFWRAFARFLPDDVHRPLSATVLTLLVMCAGVLDRTMLARPEAFAMAWGVLGVSLAGNRPWRAQALFLAGGFVLSASYWVAWLAWPLVWMVPASRTRRLALLGALALFHGLFWHLYTDGAYWQVLSLLRGWNANRLLVITETTSLAHLLVRPGMVVALALAWAGATPAARRTPGWRAGMLALLPYLMLNMQRYVGNVLASLLPLVAAGWNRLQLGAKAQAVLGAALLLLGLQGIETSELPDFRLPAGAVVLTTMSQATFAVPMANPGTVSTLPAMEVGASTHRVQEQVLALRRSRVDCGELRALGVTHIVEKSWVGDPAACMSLQQTRGAWRLWSVR